MYSHEFATKDDFDKSNSSRKLQRTMSEASSSSIAASPYWGMKKQEGKKEEGVSPIVAFCFTINYILGTGFLTVPWAFMQGGLVLSTVVLVLVGVLSDMSKTYILESMARAEAMLDDRMHWVKKKTVNRTGGGGDEEKQPLMVYSPMVYVRSAASGDDNDSGNKEQEQSLTDPVKNYESSVGSSAPSLRIPPVEHAPFSALPTTPDRRRLLMMSSGKEKPEKYLVKNRKFEINTMCRVFLGKPALRVYTAFICLYLYCSLWAYTSVFGNALARMVPIPGVEDSYLVYATIYATIVIPASCMELSEQVFVQVMMTLARFAMLFFMVGTAGMISSQEDRMGEGEIPVPVPMFRLAGLSKMVPVMAFAQIYHHSIPGLSLPVADKKLLPTVFRSTTLFCTFAYSFIGCFLGLALGQNIEESSNLNWEGLAASPTSSSWMRAISRYVVLFPAIDVVSAFPLNAITLGNNMLAAFYGSRIHEVENNWWVRTRFRLLATIPPIILGIFERKLGTITEYAGTLGFVIGFSFPAMLYIRSRRHAKKKHFSVLTYYTTYSSSNACAWTVCVFGVFMMLYVIFF